MNKIILTIIIVIVAVILFVPVIPFKTASYPAYGQYGQPNAPLDAPLPYESCSTNFYSGIGIIGEYSKDSSSSVKLSDQTYVPYSFFGCYNGTYK